MVLGLPSLGVGVLYVSGVDLLVWRYLPHSLIIYHTYSPRLWTRDLDQTSSEIYFGHKHVYFCPFPIP